jgi:hypothetical protein
MSNFTDRLECTTEADEFFDYCLWEYKPAEPWVGKLRSVNLLLHSFDLVGVDPRLYDLVQAIRDGIGVSRTVWGLKQVEEGIRWEFYFYDYRRRARERSISRLLDILGPFARCGFRPDEQRDYFMFSIDVDGDLAAGTRALDEIHMYIGNVGSTVSSGICYSLSQHGTRLENFYFFFDAKTQLREITGKIASSAFVDGSSIDINRILWPELRNCRVIVVANKQGNDCIYFSRITVDQLLFFLKRMNYRRELVSFVEENRSMLDHLQYDVGFDYRMEEGELKILKSGYYGVF